MSAPADWMPLVWDKVRSSGWSVPGTVLAAAPWETLDEALAPAGGITAVFRRYVYEAMFPASPTGVIGQLHKMIGAPPAAVLRAGDGPRAFILGMMAAQYLRCGLSTGTKQELVITDLLSRGSEVRAWWVNSSDPARHRELKKLASREPSEAERDGGDSGDHGRKRKITETIWEIPLGNCPTDMDSLLVSVCQPDFDRGSVVFSAEVKERL